MLTPKYTKHDDPLPVLEDDIVIREALENNEVSLRDFGRIYLQRYLLIHKEHGCFPVTDPFKSLTPMIEYKKSLMAVWREEKLCA